MNTFEQFYTIGCIVFGIFFIFFIFHQILEEKKDFFDFISLIRNFFNKNHTKQKEEKKNLNFSYYTNFVDEIANDLRYDSTAFIPPLKNREESFLFLRELDDYLIEKNNLALFIGSSILTDKECQEILNIHIDNCIFHDGMCKFTKKDTSGIFTSVDLEICKINDDIDDIIPFLTPTAMKNYLKCKGEFQNISLQKEKPTEKDIENLDHLIFLELEKYKNG